MTPFPLGAAGDVLAAADFEPAWTFAAQRCAQADGARIEMAVPDDDDALRNAARRAGFAPSQESYAVSWLDPAARRDPRRSLPEGYRIVARAEDRTRPHPMIRRNGAEVEDGLRQCSLYDPHLDLAVLAPDGTVAGYALFWPDLVTGVGLVEPMRVEDAHAGHGLGTHLLDAGLRGLTARGCARLKVSFEPSNTPAVRLNRATLLPFACTPAPGSWCPGSTAPGGTPVTIRPTKSPGPDIKIKCDKHDLHSPRGFAGHPPAGVPPTVAPRVAQDAGDGVG
jgi:GNAT superfamily N-acetyltransferase